MSVHEKKTLLKVLHEFVVEFHSLPKIIVYSNDNLIFSLTTNITFIVKQCTRHFLKNKYSCRRFNMIVLRIEWY